MNRDFEIRHSNRVHTECLNQMPRTEDAAPERDSSATLCDNCCKAESTRVRSTQCKTATCILLKIDGGAAFYD